MDHDSDSRQLAAPAWLKVLAILNLPVVILFLGTGGVLLKESLRTGSYSYLHLLMPALGLFMLWICMTLLGNLKRKNRKWQLESSPFQKKFLLRVLWNGLAIYLVGGFILSILMRV